MLKPLVRVLLGSGLAAGFLVAAPSAAHADFCVQVAVGKCSYVAITGDSDGEPCVNYGVTVPCTRGFPPGTGHWSNHHNEYVVALPTAWVWKGHEATGRFAFFFDPGSTGPILGFTEGNLPIRAVGPDPRQLATQLIASMNLAPITIGIVPDPLPGRVGIIGMPQWMWAENPSENTVGPMARTVTQGGVTVSATGTMSRIAWNMGDGSVVTCGNVGTKYEDRYGKSPSPTCGYYYRKQGAFTVTATSYWDVTWTGAGQSGTIPLTLTSSASITMGEIQVLAR